MTLEKNKKEYEVSEQSTKWVLKRVDGILTIKYEVLKKDCPSFEELKRFIMNSNLV